MWVLIVVYIVGIVGVAWPLHPQFLALTPLNLLFSLAWVLYYHPRRELELGAGLLFCYVAGLVVECIGVQTGYPFGAYHYDWVLGPKVLGTPLMIGVNWAMLVYAVAATGHRLWGKQGAWWKKASLGASLMTGLDLFIEPVAVARGFWTWEEAGINSFLVAPWQNYVAWWCVAWAMIAVFLRLVPRYENRVAEGLLVLQFIFFILLWLMP